MAKAPPCGRIKPGCCSYACEYSESKVTWRALGKDCCFYISFRYDCHLISSQHVLFYVPSPNPPTHTKFCTVCLPLRGHRSGHAHPHWDLRGAALCVHTLAAPTGPFLSLAQLYAAPALPQQSAAQDTGRTSPFDTQGLDPLHLFSASSPPPRPPPPPQLCPLGLVKRARLPLELSRPLRLLCPRLKSRVGRLCFSRLIF